MVHKLIVQWRGEEALAHIHGWDFSHIAGRYTEQDDLPWDYQETILRWLRPEMKILDIDTGGGEFLLSLAHPYENTGATENYPPNIELCRQILTPLGINFRTADGKSRLPFDDGSFHNVRCILGPKFDEALEQVRAEKATKQSESENKLLLK